jgi:transposase InsO family protein
MEIGLVMLDIFSKYAVVIPIESKETPDVIAGIMEGFVKMGKKPKRIYSDNEGAIKSNLFEQYCKENNIQLIFTRTHAWAVERFSRTLKDKMLKRLEYDKTKDFKQILFEVLLTYNNKDIHTSTGLTPNEARKDENGLQVKLNLEMHRLNKRKYPD